MNTSATQPAFPIVAFDQAGEMTTPEGFNGLTKLELFSKDVLCAIIEGTIAKEGNFDAESEIKASIMIAKGLINALNQQR